MRLLLKIALWLIGLYIALLIAPGIPGAISVAQAGGNIEYALGAVVGSVVTITLALWLPISAFIVLYILLWLTRPKPPAIVTSEPAQTDSAKPTS
jgi:hypothetical protein